MDQFLEKRKKKKEKKKKILETEVVLNAYIVPSLDSV